MGHGNSTEKPPHPTENFAKLFGDANFSDFKLIVGKGVAKSTFNVHRCILATHSPVFDAMFRSEMREKNEASTTIDDVDSEVMQEFLRFIYVGKVEKLDDFARDLWIVADKYELKGLKEVCETRLIEKLSVDTVYETLCMIDNFSIAKLKEATMWFIINNADGLGKNNKFKNSIKTLSSDLLVDVVCASLTKSYSP